jgi:pimeloyl-ACP methyl ester carboxylesterase
MTPTNTTPTRVNDLYYERQGSGDPLVLVHGSWGSTQRWALIVEDLARSFDVINYDRRSYGRSPDGTSLRRDEEDELAALIEALGIAPAHLVGSSYGGGIVLGLASRRPDLVRSASVHEAPLMSYGPGDVVDQVQADFDYVAGLIEQGDARAAAKTFVERIALGPGGWEMMPPENQEGMIRGARGFAREMSDEHYGEVDLEAVECPVLLTEGNASPAWFAPIMEGARAAMPHAESLTIIGSGHIPHITHPSEYVEVLTRFAKSVA